MPLPVPGQVAVVGVGTMGVGIAQLALEAGHPVDIHDLAPAALARGRARIAKGLERRATSLGLDPESGAAWAAGRLAGLRVVPDLDPLLQARPELVVEAVIEDLAIKRQLFTELDRGLDPGSIIATNTSAISIAAIAAAAASPGRVLGLHFFNPAPVMPLVEVVVGPATLPNVADRAAELVAAWGKTVVRCTDSPGFIVNRVNRPFTLEALAMLVERAATVMAIDAAVRGAGFPMGPFALMDLIGIDVNLAASRTIFDRSVDEGDDLAERFRPSTVQERLVRSGRLGRKTGSGFYRYDAQGVETPSSEFAAGEPATLAPSAIVERITLAIVNEAYRALGDDVAGIDDIDLAMRLGAGHPFGPFERVAALGGPGQVLVRLQRLAAFGPRFVPAPALIGDI